MKTTTVSRPPSPLYPMRWRMYYPLLAILALVLTSLACITSELSLVVKHDEGQVDTLDVQFQRYMLESYANVAKEINQERKADFTAAGRSTDTEDLLPVTREDFGELLDPQLYEDQGYSISSSERGFSATKSLTLDKEQVADDWSVEIIHNPDHPEQITYRAKIWLDLTDMENSIFQLRSQTLPAKPNLNPGSASGISGNSFGDAFSLFGGMSEELEQEMAIEMWYIQKALQKSDPIEFTFSVELNDSRPHLSNEINKGFTGLKSMIKRLIDHGKAAGELHPDTDAGRVTEVLFSGMLGATVIYGLDKSTSSLDNAINALIDYLENMKV